MNNWEHINIIDISNTNNATKRYTILYRKIICIDNAEIQAKKYRIVLYNFLYFIDAYIND